MTSTRDEEAAEVWEALEGALSGVDQLREAIRLTREYFGPRAMPAIPGWSWYDAVERTGGFDGFGSCGRVLDPQVHGRPSPDHLHYCYFAAGHDGDCGLGGRP